MIYNEFYERFRELCLSHPEQVLDVKTPRLLILCPFNADLATYAALMPPPGLMKTKSEAKGAPESSLASSRPAKRQRSGATTRRAAEWAASADAAALVATQRTHSNVASSQQQQDKTDSSEVLLVRAGKAQVGQSRLAAGTGTAIAKKAATKVAAAPPATIAEDDTAEVEPPKPEASPEAEAAPAERSPPAKRQRRIARAHIPPALSRELLRVTDRLSGPRYEDTDEGHYVFTIGDNLTPRCTFFFSNLSHFHCSFPAC